MEHEDKVSSLGIGLVSLTILACFAGGWRFANLDPIEGTLDRIRTLGVVRIGYANEKPYGYLDTRTGEITGEAPEIAEVILKRMGAARIEPVVTEFGSLIPGLKAGRFDVIAAGMYITPERAEEIDFSNPSYMIGESFLVAEGNPLDLHSFEDVASDQSARLGVMGGSVEHGYAQDLGVPDSRIVIFPNYPSAVAGLQADRVDAVAATVLTVNDLLSKLGDDANVEAADPFHDPVIDGRSVRGYGAFGFRQSDGQFREEFNRELKAFLGTPEHLKLVEPFGFNEETLPGGTTAEDVIEAQ